MTEEHDLEREGRAAEIERELGKVDRKLPSSSAKGLLWLLAILILLIFLWPVCSFLG